MRRGRACVGLIVVCAAGALLGGAGGLRGLVLWGSGGSGLLLGIVLVLSSLRAPRPRAAASAAAPPPPQQWVEWQQTAVPRIGTILIDKYGFITPGELDRALEIQKGSPQRLGEILVDMGVLSERDLQMALDYQRSLQRRSWRQTDSAPLADHRARNLIR